MIKNYLSLVKFSHTIFALPFALIGYFLAIHQDYSLSYIDLALVVFCMVTARNTAMAFNRYIDADIDAKNPRTAVRDIPAGKVSKPAALGFIIVNAILFIVATYFIRPICLYLSPIAIGLVMLYSLTKRFTALCHIVLGMSLALAPIGAYIAASGTMHVEVILLSIVVLAWVAGFDIIYALQDIDFDQSQKLKSIPSLLGVKGAKLVSKLLHLLAAGLVLYLGVEFETTLFYYIGTGLFIGLLIMQHVLIYVKGMRVINLAFFTANGFASILYALFYVLGLFL